MIHIGFWFDYGLKYAGGLNYFRNLLYAIHAARPTDVRTSLFIGKDLPDQLEHEFARLTRVVKLDLLTRGTRQWFAHRLLYRSVRSQIFVERELRKHDVDILSHPSMVERLSRQFKLISWIPDFQYVHLPELFPQVDPAKRNRAIAHIHRHSGALVVSSQHAFRDFEAVMGQQKPGRTHVLPFVSQLHLGDVDVDITKALLDKYALPDRYLFLPNQFWVHKNHRRTFEAVALLKQEGIYVTLVCTGWMRDPNHASTSSDGALGVIEREGLQQQVRLLGSIDYADVIGLMRGCVAVVNPSLFEGWSSSVEESRSIGKPAILSDIPVHREQAHPAADYFDPHSVPEIAKALGNAWQSLPHGVSMVNEAQAQDALHRRTSEFGRRYLDIARAVACSTVRAPSN